MGTHAHTHARMHACTHSRTHACMHTHTHTHARMHACMHIRTHARTHTSTHHIHPCLSCLPALVDQCQCPRGQPATDRDGRAGVTAPSLHHGGHKQTRWGWPLCMYVPVYMHWYECNCVLMYKYMHVHEWCACIRVDGLFMLHVTAFGLVLSSVCRFVC